MKRSIYFFGSFLFAAGLILSSCEKSSAPEAPAFVLSATQDGGEATKTQLGTPSDPSDHVYEILWKTGDKVSINGTLSNALASDDNGERSVDFTFSSTPSGSIYKVLYPGITSSDRITLPATQSYVAGNIDGSAAVSYGNATESGGNYSVSLTPFCGILRFALKGSATISQIVLNSVSGDEMLSGKFDLTVGPGGFTGSFSEVDGQASSTLTYNVGGVTLSGSDTYFYVCIPAQTYSSGVIAKVYQSDGAYMQLKFWGSGNTLDSRDLIEFESKTYAAGRSENLLQINSLTSESGGNPTVTPPSITVACYNVMRLDDDNRPADAREGDSNGKLARPANAIIKTNSAMRAALGLAIYNTNADVIGFNEIGDDMYQSGQAYSLQDIVASQGANYTWCLNYPGSQSGNYHYCNGFIYKAAVLTLNESGRAWLRYNSDSYSTSSDSNSGDPNRYIVWAKFTHKVSGKVFYLFVTQLPTYGQNGGGGSSNLYMSGGVNAFAASKSADRRILVGDMNSVDHANNSNQAGADKLLEYWTDGYEAVLAAGNLSSFYQTYSGTQTGTGDTYQYDWTRFTKNHPERRLDHVMVQGKCTVKSYRTVRNTYTVSADGYDDIECCPSDHFPVVCEISLDD